MKTPPKKQPPEKRRSPGSTCEQAAIFQSNRSQAVRLPKSVAFPDSVKRVDVVVVGNTRILTPAGASWDSWFEKWRDLDMSDFMTQRQQPDEQKREFGGW